jgi:solute carrier family 25 carnitine/acylcarnitine transporter 20/29
MMGVFGLNPVVMATLTAGTAGGVAQAIVGHPLDTIKVRLQASQGIATEGGAELKGPLDAISQTMRKEGIRGFFKGLSVPIAMAGVLNAVLFSANAGSKTLLASALEKRKEDLSLSQVALAATLSAPVYAAALVPADFVKAQLQVQRPGVQQLYTGAFDCLAQNLRQKGVRSVYRGYCTTWFMRSLSLPLYLTSYDATKRYFSARSKPQKDARGQDVACGAPAPPPSAAVALTAGSVAGLTMWAILFPLDVIKTRLQTQRTGGGSALAACRAILRQDGWRGFFRGYTVCLARAVPANAVVFLVVEQTMGLLGQSAY